MGIRGRPDPGDLGGGGLKPTSAHLPVRLALRLVFKLDSHKDWKVIRPRRIRLYVVVEKRAAGVAWGWLKQVNPIKAGQRSGLALPAVVPGVLLTTGRAGVVHDLER